MDLEIILKEYFHCPAPFGCDGTLTEYGAKKLNQLTKLVRDLESIGVIENTCDAEQAILRLAEEKTRHRK